MALSLAVQRGSLSPTASLKHTTAAVAETSRHFRAISGKKKPIQLSRYGGVQRLAFSSLWGGHQSVLRQRLKGPEQQESQKAGSPIVAQAVSTQSSRRARRAENVDGDFFVGK